MPGNLDGEKVSFWMRYGGSESNGKSKGSLNFPWGKTGFSMSVPSEDEVKT